MLKYGIEIQQRSQSGILGGPKECAFTVTFDSITYEISIEQFGTRKIFITTESDIELDNIVILFDKLDMLIMLGEGQFLTVTEAQVIRNGVAFKSDDINSIFEKRLKKFNSADFTTGKHSKFLSFDDYIDANRFGKWIELLKELDILHSMVLYSMADTGMTIDCKSAFLIESFEALSELIEKYDASFKRPKVNNDESKLRKYICTIIKDYGADIFSKETSAGLEKVAQVFVNSRNRICHIKSRQNKKYLNGEESLLYAIKMSFLYRRVLLFLLGVDYELYSNEIIQSIGLLDEWNNVLDNFLTKV